LLLLLLLPSNEEAALDVLLAGFDRICARLAGIRLQVLANLRAEKNILG